MLCGVSVRSWFLFHRWFLLTSILSGIRGAIWTNGKDWFSW